MFACLFTAIPYWTFYVLELRKAIHIFKDAFFGRFIKMFYNYHYIAATIYVRSFLGLSVINSTLYASHLENKLWHKTERTS